MTKYGSHVTKYIHHVTTMFPFLSHLCSICDGLAVSLPARQTLQADSHGAEASIVLE